MFVLLNSGTLELRYHFSELRSSRLKATRDVPRSVGSSVGLLVANTSSVCPSPPSPREDRMGVVLGSTQNGIFSSESRYLSRFIHWWP
jgi:hypothetical protein